MILPVSDHKFPPLAGQAVSPDFPGDFASECQDSVSQLVTTVVLANLNMQFVGTVLAHSAVQQFYN
jgi:hypothetical protein